MITAGKGAQQTIDDIRLSRRACHLIAVNGDPRKKEAIAAAQQYFVEQTRRHELLEQASSDMERLTARRTLDQREHELRIEAASRGVDEHGFAKVRHAGHKALFAKSPDKVKEAMDVRKDREIADFAQPVIVAGMGFATALTTHQTRAKDLLGTKQISDEHVDNHSAVRKTMTDRSIFPETLPPAGDIKVVEQRMEKQQKKLAGRNVEC